MQVRQNPRSLERPKVHYEGSYLVFDQSFQWVHLEMVEFLHDSPYVKIINFLSSLKKIYNMSHVKPEVP